MQRDATRHVFTNTNPCRWFSYFFSYSSSTVGIEKTSNVVAKRRQKWEKKTKSILCTIKWLRIRTTNECEEDGHPSEPSPRQRRCHCLMSYVRRHNEEPLNSFASESFIFIMNSFLLLVILFCCRFHRAGRDSNQIRKISHA